MRDGVPKGGDTSPKRCCVSPHSAEEALGAELLGKDKAPEKETSRLRLLKASACFPLGNQSACKHLFLGNTNKHSINTI